MASWIGSSRIPAKSRADGQCDFKIDFDRDIVETWQELKVI